MLSGLCVRVHCCSVPRIRLGLRPPFPIVLGSQRQSPVMTGMLGSYRASQKTVCGQSPGLPSVSSPSLQPRPTEARANSIPPDPWRAVTTKLPPGLSQPGRTLGHLLGGGFSAEHRLRSLS